MCCSMKKDTLFQSPRQTVTPFEFNKSVVDVFDDMIHRSVPFYAEILKQLTRLAVRAYQPDSEIYDLGCSNGNFGLALLAEMGTHRFQMTAVDNSRAMLEAYRKRLASRPNADCIKLILDDMLQISIENASVVVINLTMQFIPVASRNSVIQNIYNALCPRGALLVTEKVVHENDDMTQLQQDVYYRYKKENGYSNLEISQKRDALENVLIPETIETHIHRFQNAGFKAVDIFHKWFNFTSFICIKS